MSEQEFIELTLDFSNDSSDEETLERLTQVLYRELSQMSEIKEVTRVSEPLPLGKKGEGRKKGGWLKILLGGEKNFKKVLLFFCTWRHGKPFSIERYKTGEIKKIYSNCFGEQEIIEIIEKLK
jgi:hypothetical protein